MYSFNLLIFTVFILKFRIRIRNYTVLLIVTIIILKFRSTINSDYVEFTES